MRSPISERVADRILGEQPVSLSSKNFGSVEPKFALAQIASTSPISARVADVMAIDRFDDLVADPTVWLDLRSPWLSDNACTR